MIDATKILVLSAMLVTSAYAALDIQPLADPHAGDQVLIGPVLVGGIAKTYREYDNPDNYTTTKIEATSAMGGLGGHFDYHFGMMFFKTQLLLAGIMTDDMIMEAEWENYYGWCFASGKFRPYIMPGAGMKISYDDTQTSSSFLAAIMFGILFKPNMNFSMLIEGGYKGITSEAAKNFAIVRNMYDMKLTKNFGFRFGFDMQSEISKDVKDLDARVYLGPDIFF